MKLGAVYSFLLATTSSATYSFAAYLTASEVIPSLTTATSTILSLPPSIANPAGGGPGSGGAVASSAYTSIGGGALSSLIASEPPRKSSAAGALAIAGFLAASLFA